MTKKHGENFIVGPAENNKRSEETGELMRKIVKKTKFHLINVPFISVVSEVRSTKNATSPIEKGELN